MAFRNAFRKSRSARSCSSRTSRNASTNLDFHTGCCATRLPREGGWQGCVGSHYATEHKDEQTTGACFVCRARVRDDFKPIVAEVQLHRPVMFYDDNRARNHWFTYSGTLVTWPVSYLCPRHVDLVQLPLRRAGPTDASIAMPEDVIAV